MSERDDAAGAAFKIVLGFVFACIVVAAGIGVIIGKILVFLRG